MIHYSGIVHNKGGGVMSLDTIISLVGSLGFPIVCCGALFYQQNKTMKDFCERIESAISTLSSSIEKSTISTEKLQTTVQIISGLGDSKNG